MSRTDIEINIASNSYIDTFARFVRLKVNEKTGV